MTRITLILALAAGLAFSANLANAQPKCGEDQFERAGKCYNSLGDIPGRTRGGSPERDAGPKRSCTISMSKFETLQHGMTYAEAKEIVGCAGKQFSYMELAGNNVTIYRWNGPGCDGCSGAFVTFANGSLQEKSQVGLDQ